MRTLAEEAERNTDRGAFWNILLFCSFAICRSFKPSAAFLVEFLISKDIEGLDNAGISRDVLSCFTYGRLPALLFCTLLSHLFGCKKVVIIGAVCAVFCTAATVFSQKVILLQASQVSMSISYAAFLAFEALQFQCLHKSKYQFIAHMTKGSTFIASFASSLAGQGLKYYVRNEILFLITLLFEVSGLIIAILLPADTVMPKSERDEALVFRLLESPETELQSNIGNKDKNPSKSHGILEVFKESNMWRWALWYICCYQVHDLTMTYWQVLAEVKMTDSSTKYNRNGLILCSANLFAALATISTSRWTLLSNIPNVVMTVSPAFMAMCMLFMAESNLLGFYIGFILFQGSFETSYATRNASIAYVLNEMGDEETKKYSFTYLISNVMWITCGISLSFELLIGLVLGCLRNVSFADGIVWEAMSVFLVGCSLSFLLIAVFRKKVNALHI